ncbi:MAG: argininosuccinate lyase, partial [Candidatus Dadabacteria bacterium]|nr:argininosuccinate lyase [Candidatus Dadabacteria bacterium]
NRDLQWDKRVVFETVDASQEALTVLKRLIDGLHVRREKLAGLLESDALCAADLAEHLVERGVAFRQAHEIVGKVVAFAERSSVRLGALHLADLKRFSESFGPAALTLTDPRRSVARKPLLML